MLIPYNTDAPLYHPPFATVATIIVNVLLFVPVFIHEDPYALEAEYLAQQMEEEGAWDEMDFEQIPMVDEDGQPLDEETRREYEQMVEELKQRREQYQQGGGPRKTTVWRLMTLEFGKFRPWQWLTANYMHADILHLLGNMFVLWGFGLVVEGKVGWWRFLVIYNLIGVAGWCLVQFLTLFASAGIGLGASLAIFGILVISLVWAPANDMQCLFLFGFRVIAFEASIMTIAIGSVFLQLAISALYIVIADDMSMALRITSEVLHLIGGAFGLAVGIVMVKRNLVDCENWDMFSVWAGKHIRTNEEDKADVHEQLEKIKRLEQKQRMAGTEEPRGLNPTTFAAPEPDLLVAQFRQLVEAGKPLDAWNLFCRAQQTNFGWQVPEPDFVKYISVLRQQKMWDHAAGAMQEYLQRYFERETTIRLALAQLYVQHLQNPQEARSALEPINEVLLNPKEKAAYDKIVAVLPR